MILDMLQHQHLGMYKNRVKNGRKIFLNFPLLLYFANGEIQILGEGKATFFLSWVEFGLAIFGPVRGRAMNFYLFWPNFKVKSA